MTTDPEIVAAVEQEIGVIARRLRKAISERARAVHPELQRGDYVVLDALHHAGPARAADLAEWLDLDKGAVSRHVRHLGDLGLVRRSADPHDGRACLLSVSEEAAERLTEVGRVRSAAAARKLAGWAPEELSALVATLARYNRTMSTDPDAAGDSAERGRVDGDPDVLGAGQYPAALVVHR